MAAIKAVDVVELIAAGDALRSIAVTETIGAWALEPDAEKREGLALDLGAAIERWDAAKEPS